MATASLGLGISPLMLAPVTATWSAPFVAYLALLSNRVVYYRITEKTSFRIGARIGPPLPRNAVARQLFGKRAARSDALAARRAQWRQSQSAAWGAGDFAVAAHGAHRVGVAEQFSRDEECWVREGAGVLWDAGVVAGDGGLGGLGAGVLEFLRRNGWNGVECFVPWNKRKDDFSTTLHLSTRTIPAIALQLHIRSHPSLHCHYSALTSTPTFPIPIASTAIMSNAPTLINLPPPPSDPVTPSDVPGTPNSTTTSMSELSTVAIKDGHRGHLPHHHQQHPLEAERADRISRLAGLERVGVAGGRPSNLNPSSAMGSGAIPSGPQTQGYFDANNQPQLVRERSTVGSASATGSVGGRTTWASGSDVGYDPSIADRMSEDQDMDTSSVGGFSDEGAPSLVGFGEGARTPARTASHLGSPVVGKASTSASASAVPPYLRDRPDSMQSSGGGGSVTGFQGNMSQGPPSPMTGVSGTDGPRSGASTPSTEAQVRDAQRIDGMTYDAGDTTGRAAPLEQSASAAHADRWLDRQAERERSERQQ
ncbi:uncharacterized protein IWZ02DRAFT_430424 [Phyllosticta citriasiana]